MPTHTLKQKQYTSILKYTGILDKTRHMQFYFLPLKCLPFKHLSVKYPYLCGLDVFQRILLSITKSRSWDKATLHLKMHTVNPAIGCKLRQNFYGGCPSRANIISLITHCSPCRACGGTRWVYCKAQHHRANTVKNIVINKWLTYRLQRLSAACKNVEWR